MKICCLSSDFFFFCFILFTFFKILKTIYFLNLFLERGEGRGEERERNIDVRQKHQSVASPTLPDQGLNLQPRHVP